MNGRTLYVVDACAFINTKSLTSSSHSFAFACLEHLAEQGTLASPREVWKELETKDKTLGKWSESARERLWKPCDLAALKHVLSLVPEVQDSDRSSSDGPEEADPYVVALAHKLRAAGTHESVVVVSDDTRDRAQKSPVASACGLIRIPSIATSRFLINELSLFRSIMRETSGKKTSPALVIEKDLPEWANNILLHIEARKPPMT